MLYSLPIIKKRRFFKKAQNWQKMGIKMIEIIILILATANLVIELAILLKLQDKCAADLDFLVEVPPYLIG